MRDGKLAVGDKIVQINGVDVTDARHDQAVSMLTGLERFVRLDDDDYDVRMMMIWIKI